MKSFVPTRKQSQNFGGPLGEKVESFEATSPTPFCSDKSDEKWLTRCQAIRPSVWCAPGIMELAVVVAVALTISRVVKVVASAGREANALYSEIHRGVQERKLNDLDIKRRELELTQEQLAFAREAQDRLSEVMGFPYLEALRKLTTNEVAGLKILLSIFRRARLLGDDERDGNLRL